MIHLLQAFTCDALKDSTLFVSDTYMHTHAPYACMHALRIQAQRERFADRDTKNSSSSSVYPFRRIFEAQIRARMAAKLEMFNRYVCEHVCMSVGMYACMIITDSCV